MGFKNSVSFASSDTNYRTFIFFLVFQINQTLYSLFASRERKHNLMMYRLAFAVSCPIAMR